MSNKDSGRGLFDRILCYGNMTLWAILWVFGFEKKDSLKSIVKSVSIAIVLALIIRSFFFQSFNVPSGSMHPTLKEGDYLLVNKMAYGYSRYALPFFPPLFEGRCLASKPKRGEVVVFVNPQNTDMYYVKRLIGLPGDRITMRHGILHVNNKAVHIAPLPDYKLEYPHEEAKAVSQYMETLPEGVQHRIVHDMPLGQHSLDHTDTFVVPEKHLFFIGDNRTGSADSRVLEGLGYVHEDYLVGRVSIIFFSIDSTVRLWEPWRWLGSIRYSRIFKFVS